MQTLCSRDVSLKFIAEVPFYEYVGNSVREKKFGTQPDYPVSHDGIQPAGLTGIGETPESSLRVCCYLFNDQPHYLIITRSGNATAIKIAGRNIDISIRAFGHVANAAHSRMEVLLYLCNFRRIIRIKDGAI